MKNLTLTCSILLLFSTNLFSQNIQTRTGDFPEKEMKLQNKEIAKLVATEISETLPQTIDKYTELVDVTSVNSTLLYTFEINTGVKSDKAVINEDRTRMKRAVQTGICQSSRKFLQAGINTSYIYVSAKTKAHLFQFDVSQKDCIKLMK